MRCFTGNINLQTETAGWIFEICLGHLAHNLRTEREPVFVKGFLSNHVISIWAIIVLLSLVVITIIPDLQILLQTDYLTYTDWILIIFASLASTFWMEAYKAFRYFRKGFGVVLN